MNETEYATTLSYANGLIQKQQETIDEQYHTISTANIWNSKLKDQLDIAVKSLEEIRDNTDVPISSKRMLDSYQTAKLALEQISKLSKEREK